LAVVLSTQTPLIRVLPTPQAAATGVIGSRIGEAARASCPELTSQ